MKWYSNIWNLALYINIGANSVDISLLVTVSIVYYIPNLKYFFLVGGMVVDSVAILADNVLRTN